MAGQLDEARRQTARAVIDARKKRRRVLLKDVPDPAPAPDSQAPDEQAKNE